MPDQAEAPDYGSHPDCPIASPRGVAYLAFRPAAAGTTLIVAFGHDQYQQARHYAARENAIVTQALVLADYS